MDVFTISLENVRMMARIGVFEFERSADNEFEVNLSVSVPAPERLEDDIAATVSYADLFGIVKAVMAGPHQLLETVAQKIVGEIQSEFPRLISIECKVTKLNPPIPDFSGKASVYLRRSIAN